MGEILKYLSFRGRANRLRYWLTTLVLWVVSFGAAMVAVFLMATPVLGVVGTVLAGVLIVVVAVAGLANGARRLHDRGKSAWWLLVFVAVPLLLSMPGELARTSPDESVQAGGALLAVLGLPFSIWGFVVMGCLRGTVGPNKFGEDPLHAPAQEVFA